MAAARVPGVRGAAAVPMDRVAEGGSPVLLTLIAAPSFEPISLAEAKLHLKSETTDDDALIGTIIAAARELAEQRTGRALIDQRWERVLDVFPDAIQLARPPLVSVESLKYVD